MIKYLTLVAFVFFSCTKNVNQDLNAKFRETVIAYQNKFPIPEETQKSNYKERYIYEAFFYQKNKDTFFALTRKNQRAKEFVEEYEIYTDDALKPLMILDYNNYAHNFVRRKRKDLQYSLWSVGEFIDVQHTRLYKYKIRNKDFELAEIDTIARSGTDLQFPKIPFEMKE